MGNGWKHRETPVFGKKINTAILVNRVAVFLFMDIGVSIAVKQELANATVQTIKSAKEDLISPFALLPM